MAERDLCLVRSQGPSGELVVRLGDPVLDGYLEASLKGGVEPVGDVRITTAAQRNRCGHLPSAGRLVGDPGDPNKQVERV